MGDDFLSAIRERLLADQKLGATAVPVGREVLVSLLRGAARPSARPAASPSGWADPARRVPGQVPAAPTAPPPTAPRPRLAPARAPAGPAPKPAAPAPVVQDGQIAPIPLPILEPDPVKALDLLNRAHILGCTKCAVLAAGRTKTVFGVGNPASPLRLVFVGEAPGEDEDRTGIPFVGRAGQLLTKMIEAMGLDREHDVYICNVLKCRPPNNRTPAPDEVANCSPFLWEQLRILNPRVIVTLGNPATQTLLNTKTGITRLRGTWQSLTVAGLADPIKVMPTYHPSYLLRQGERDASGRPPQAKREAWSDLQQVMAELGIAKKGKA